MDKNNDSQSAFPTPADCNAFGMTLRDYFAAKTMNGMLSNEQYDEFLGAGDFSVVVGRYAQLAYKYADAMLQERAK